jgi:tetratricopeptide (TPR) repeat protein
MPPWKPTGDAPAFVGERRLTDQELDIIARWAREGAPKGAIEDLPKPPAASSGWLWGEPDLVVSLPRYSLRADGGDVFRNFVVTVPGRGTRYVRGLQFRPRSRAVHHANIRIDPTGASRAVDEADPAPGYEGVILHSADYPDGHFLGWTPGQAPPPSNELAWKLEGGADLVVQLHVRPTGRAESIAPLIGLYFTSDPPAQRPAIVRLGKQDLDIPAESNGYAVADSFRLPVDAQVVAVQPHAHYRARSVSAWATLPDGSRRPLLQIDDWDFNWQDQYRFSNPFWLPAGTTVSMTYIFDNRSTNPRNPSGRAERVQWGWRTSDEMADVWIQMLTRTPADQRALSSAARRKMTAEDAVGVEVLVAREPDYVSLRNDAAVINRELGRFDRALVHFAAVTRLQPQSAAAHYNEGVVLEALGREADAVEEYTAALRLDSSYALAHNAMGNVNYRAGRIDEAMSEYRAAIAAEPALPAPRCSLARALTVTGRPGDAAREYQAALAVAPDSAPCLINFAWLLAAHEDTTVRQPVQAVALAEHAVAVTEPDSADALDALGAAYASAGRFDDAVAAAVRAVALFESAGQRPAVDEVRTRIDLYRRHVPFIISSR